ncbi:MAG: M24 family metallopeptidase [Acidimicrobiales bacterium]
MDRRAVAAKRAAKTVRQSFNDRPLLLTSPGSVNWRSGGMSDPIDLTASSDPLWTLDCAHGSALITSEVEAPRFESDYHARALGWEVLRAPWYDAKARLALAGSYADVDPRELLSDSDAVGDNIRDHLIAARLVLSSGEQEELRELGPLVGAALGAGIDAWRPGESTDFHTSAVISSVLEAEGAKAVCLIVGGDDRLRTLRHPLAVGDVLHDSIMAVVVAKRAGLHVAATRVCVRRKDDEIVALMKRLDVVNDAVLDASLPGGTWGETIAALASGYDAVAEPGAWREHFQGGPIGFEQREFELAPVHDTSPFWGLRRAANTAVAWNPSLRGGAKIEETYLVNEGLEWLTPTASWPTLEGPHGSRRGALKVLQ